MRKHGWQLPYHPLQVVAIAVFLALGFAFYVFFVPFVGEKPFQYVVMGLYTPLVIFVFLLYVWCAATDPGDPGIFKSKKYLKGDEYKGQLLPVSRETSLMKEVMVTNEDKLDEGISTDGHNINDANTTFSHLPLLAILFSWCPGKIVSNCCRAHEQSPEQQMSEEGMFYCSLCEVEVLKYSKHCRVCDKCVDGFDHHCRWLNNCIGRKNYRKFFILMVLAFLLLIVQWLTGILVLVICFIKRKHFSVEVTSKLGSSFSLVPFVVVVVSCTSLAMVATIPLAQLFFFHVLLIKKGITTYDYIIALREQEQEQEEQAVGNQQSPQMSQTSSVTGLSSTSSFNAFHRGSWCTPPRLFLEDQFDVIPPEVGVSMIQANKKIGKDESTKRKAGTVKINPWTLARLNADEVSKAAAEARKKSKILQPIARREMLPSQDTDSSVGSGSGRMALRLDNKKRTNKRGRLPVGLPLERLDKISASATNSNGSDVAPETSSSLAPLHLEARKAFRPNRSMPSAGIIASSPDSSLGSPDLHPFRISSLGTEELQVAALSVPGFVVQKGIHLSRSTSDGYEASGGEDSDQIPSRIVHRSSNWANIILGSGRNGLVYDFKASS